MLQRDFVVLFRETIYDTESGKFLTKYMNQVVLIGLKAGIDKAGPIIEKFLKEFGGSFETSYRVHAVDQ